ncbi:pesticidal crystal protein cry4Aa [Bacillus sp. 17RED48]|uniref:insecticidal delta-endotoxin Cry8Ea1 family protein n=1 Tax=Bacillus sp. 17RED48 TaxID=2778093 RepID=UPI001C9A622F|nr:insecticidal delta-endotoxin Cry8Ea1 family protein [Bacillus sp. 17RED48]MBY7115263.1 pesticidal crystal protein cry4Aa [Bacillus sp. 17RED48]
MNHNNNNNEYEIIDSHTSSYPSNRNSNHSRYPYTNNPNQPLSNTNYKDWLTMCQGNQPYRDKPQTLVDTGVAISTGLIILGTIMTGFPALTPWGIGIVSFGTLLPVLWPSGETDKRVWIEFMEYGGTIFKPLLENQKEKAQGILQGFHLPINSYQNGITTWQNLRKSHIPGTPPSSALREAARVARTRIDIANSALSRISEIQSAQFGAAILPFYAQAATLHLNLLSQAVQFADQLKADAENQPTQDAGTSDEYHRLLKQYTQQYTDYCVKTYQEGLTTLKNAPDMTWNIYNTYRRDMTLLVLDYIAVFPNFDIRQYPTGTHSELTREIYTNALIKERPNPPIPIPIAQRETELTRPPHLFSRLNRLFLFSTTDPSPSALSAVQNGFTFTNNNSVQDSQIYRLINSPEPTENRQQIIISNTDVYRIELTLRQNYFITHNINFYTLDGITRRYNSGSTPETPTIINFQLPEFSADKIPPYGLGTKYSHILSYMKISPNRHNIALPNERHLSFAWTHTSVNFDNEISNQIVTQIPAVKARSLDTSSSVISGPGHTGGDLVLFRSRMEFQCFVPTETKYKIRMRYVAYSPNNSINLTLNITGKVNYGLRALNIRSTVPSEKDAVNPKYNDFQYLYFHTQDPNEIAIVNFYSLTNMTLLSNNFAGNTLVIDKIEFLPVTQTLEENLETQKLEKIQQTVNTFFTNHTKNILNIETTDYEIDQTAILVESLSEEQYPQEKMILLDTMKQAKQFSQSRNLLQNGDFSSFIGWTINNDLTLQTNNPIFKGQYLHILGARTTEIDNTIFPTYVYQKIDESKLKPYTRYVVRGCISNSKDLELFVTRYNKEIHKILNIPNDSSHMNAEIQTNSYEAQSYSFRNENNNLTNQQSPYPTTSNHSGYSESTLISSNFENENAFSFSIDTGNLDFNENLGIGILFKISNPDGYAALGNLEVIEEQPLTEEEVNRVTEKENRWKQVRNNQQKETEQAYYQAQQAIDALFINSQHQMLKIETTIQDIVVAETFIDKIPYIYKEWLPNEPGMNYTLYQGLKQQISQAYMLYRNRNLIQNGNFINSTTNWFTSPDAKVQQIDNTSILVIPNWSTQVSQNINLPQQNHQYLLRVIAKKEGIGNGYVKISDCTKHVETLIFTSCDYNNNAMWNEPMGYVTKTMHITPHTNQVRIDIGETEGTFKINSVELICIKN